MTRSRCDVQCNWVVWSCHVVSGEGFTCVGVTCTTSFNMGKCNWAHTLMSRSINRSWWLMLVSTCAGKKLFWLMNCLMKSLHAQIAELSSEMCATGWTRSNSNRDQCMIEPAWRWGKKLLLFYSSMFKWCLQVITLPWIQQKWLQHGGSDQICRQNLCLYWCQT